MSTKVLITRDGRYNDQFGKARNYLAGDILTTAHGYAQTIVASGSADSDIAPAIAAAGWVEEPPESAETLFTDVKGISEDINVSLLAIGATWEGIYKMTVEQLTVISGLGPKGAARLKAQAATEVGHGTTTRN